MKTMNNYLLLAICCLLTVTLTAWAEKDESTRPNDRMVGQVSIESPSAVFLNEAEIDSPITISGKSNLPAGTVLKITISAKISSFTGGRFDILNICRTVTDQNGRWQYVIKPTQDAPFLAETYKIEINTSASQPLPPRRDYYFSIASPIACKQRQQEIHSLYQSVTDIWNLDKELKDFISNIEDIKQGKTGWERNIQEALGIYHTPEEAMALAIKKWREWEPDYTMKLEILSDSLQTRPSLTNFITVQEQLSYLSGCLYERYAQYRSQLLGSPRKISYYPAGSGLLSPADNRNNALTIMEREIVSKIFQDTLSLMEYIDNNCINDSPDKSQWQKTRNESIRLYTILKNELEYYYRMGLFYRQPNKHFLKESQDLTDLIDTLSLLLDKLLVLDDKTRNSEEIQTIVTNLHNKITALSAEVY